MTFRKYHPVTVLIYYSAWLAMATMTKHPLVVVIACLMTFIHFRMRTTWAEASRFLAYDVCVAVLIFIASAAFKHNGMTPLFFWNDQAVTKEVLLWAVSVGILLCTIHLVYVNAVAHLATDRFLFACRLLSPALSMTLSQCFYFVPTCQKRFRDLQRTQKGLGFYRTASYADRAIGLLKISYESVTWAFEKSFQKTNAMRARGYHLKGKTVFQLYRFHQRDGIVLFVTAVCIGLFLWQYNVTAYAYFPKMDAWHMSPVALSSVVMCGLIPIVIDLKERWKWHYYSSKM